MEWADRIQVATGRNRTPGRRDWTGAESAVGTPLPEDFKELWPATLGRPPAAGVRR